MGIKLDESKKGESYKEAIFKIGRYVVYRAARVWMYPNILFMWTTLGKKHDKVLSFMSTFRNEVIKKRRESDEHKKIIQELTENSDTNDTLNGRKRLAMLDLMLQAERQGLIDGKGIGEEVDTFMFEVG